MNHKYSVRPLSFLRKVVRASASVTRQRNAILFFSEIDVSAPLEIIENYKINHGIKLSFTGYLAKSFSNVIEKYPDFNSFISGNKHVFLKEVIISILVERKIGQDHVPEPMVLKDVSGKSIIDINTEIREAQKVASQQEKFGNLNHFPAIRFIPGFLLKLFIKLADRNISMGIKYGKLAITSVGMFSKNQIWVIPHGSATVLLSVGSIIDREVIHEGKIESKKYLCLTVSFDHDIIDGAPAARFMNDLIEEIKSGKCLGEIS